MLTSHFSSRPLQCEDLFLQPSSPRCDHILKSQVWQFADQKFTDADSSRELATFISDSLISDTTPTQVRHVHLKAHRAARHACLRHACLRHACLRLACLRHACLRHACLRHACHVTIVSSHIVSARVKRAGPASHAATAQPACLRDTLRLRNPATPRTCHPVPPCDPVRLCTYAFSALQ